VIGRPLWAAYFSSQVTGRGRKMGKIVSMFVGLFANLLGLRSRVITMTPVKAADILQNWVYDRQRQTRNSLIASFMQALDEGVFRPGSQVCVALFKGRYILLDGWHRLMAIMETGVTIPVTLTVFRCDTIDQVHRLYITFDNTTSGIRNKADLFVALYGHKVVGNMPRKTVGKLISAATVISNFFSQHIVRVTTHNIALVLGCAKKFLKSMQQFILVLKNQTGALRRETLLSAPVLAVALATMEWASTMAKKYWKGVAHNGICDAGDPRTAFREFLIELQSVRRNAFNQRKGTTSYTPREISHIAAWCWNAFYNGERIYKIDVSAAATKTPIHIAGTPFQYSRDSKWFSKAMSKYGLGEERLQRVKKYADRGATSHGKQKSSSKAEARVKVDASIKMS